MRVKPLFACGAAAALLISFAGFAAPVPAPHFDTAREDLVQLLSGFIQVNTSSPPGNETKAAEYLKGFLDREGIPSEILALEPARGNLVARLKGNGKKKPLLLMGHTDVVGVERDKWTMDPFAGVVTNGYVWGRGASDDKGMTAVCLETLLLLHRLKVPLDRDVIFLAEAGEESTTYLGIDFMVKKHWDKIECEFALNEGGRIYLKGGRVHHVYVSTTEKVPRAIFLTAKGTSGHGSRPRPDNAIVHLATAVAKIGAWRPPQRMNDTTRAFFAKLARLVPPEEAYLFTHLEDPECSAEVQEKLFQKHGGYHSMLRTSVSPNMIKGGFRINVIPGDASASLDVRFHPDEDQEAFAESLRKLIDDPAVEVALAEPGSRKPTPPSRLDTEMFQALERAQEKIFPGSATLPSMLTGATDSAQLRAKGVQAYGLGGMATDDDSSRVHGNDERTSIEGLGKFLEYVWTAVTDVAAAKE